ncbi:lysylphosphatidylglycerol synthase transmembrane domain-containing protein [Nakamurella endophytica]|uniref:Flippase-like domain-containing protein n=1 Tax=Nakamurella endophytica TaxID=1748367 RepID=A0A917T3W8_9ACTN|nr:lysylphosphatidylglycerol synthase transmembrane domain-containing protein [Nakamurella endophytica]GGM08475.1 hypothetical protein GCM10011594_30500 [Nakamurella endophytica]
MRSRDIDAAAIRRTAAGLLSSFWSRPRVRRPLDLARLLLALAGLVVLATVVVLAGAGMPDPTALVPAVPARTLTRRAISLVNAASSLAILGILAVVALRALRFRRFAVTSALLSCGLGVLAGWLLPEGVRLLAGHASAQVLIGPPVQSAGIPVTAAIALFVGADLQRRRWWLVSRLAVAVVVGCSLLLGSLTVPSAAYAVLVGICAGLAVRVSLGVVPARPSELAIRTVLERGGLPVTSFQPHDDAAGRITYLAADGTGRTLVVTVIDPDRRGVPLARRAGRVVRLRAAVVGHPALSLRGQLERRALTTSLTTAAGVTAPQVLALLSAGRALVLVEQPIGGEPLRAAADGAVPSDLGPAFAALRRLHGTAVAHGALSAETVLVQPDGGVGFADFTLAQPAATELQRELDVVALLVAAAVVVGVAPAVAGLRSGYLSDAVAEARLSALLQPLVLPRPTRRALRGTSVLADLRAALAHPAVARAAGRPPRLERLRPRTVVSVVGGTVAAYVLATQLSHVNLAQVFAHARLGWLGAAVLASAVTYVGAALALHAFVLVRLPLGRTTLVQLASSFLALVTPPTVGHVGLNIRYLQRSGVPAATAAADVAVKEAVTVAVTVPVLLVCGWLSGVSGSRLSLLPSGDVLVVLAATAAAVAVVAVLPPTRRLAWRRLQPLVRQTVPQLVAALSSPRRLVLAVTGVLVLDAGYVLALGASLRAFSAELPITVLVVVYLAASAIGSAAPTPGGLGAVEAALVGGLTATGIPVAIAIPAVLVFRAATFWLPAPLGWGAFVLLQRRGRI